MNKANIYFAIGYHVAMSVRMGIKLTKATFADTTRALKKLKLY